jgi:hypothetical protein
MQSKQQAPASILDWLEKKNFESLHKTEQNEILDHFSEEEYNDMRLAMIALHAGNEEKTRRSEAKFRVLEHFKKVHASRKNILRTLLPFTTLKIAAALTPFVLAWLVFSFLRPASAFAGGTVASTDTVFVTKLIDAVPVLIHDTIYKIEKEFVKVTGEENISGNERTAAQGAIVLPEEFPVMPIENSDNAANRIKGNSMLDDSLWRRFAGSTL